jgi:hypothetical protein
MASDRDGRMRQSSRRSARVVRPVRWLLPVALALLLAGCGGKDGGAGQVRLGDGTRISLDLPEEQQPAADDIRGAVSGIVVNEAIFPVPNATVAVRDRDYQATTDADGKFVFEDMPPGLYTLTVRMDGYADGLGTVNVKSGLVTKSILQIQHLPVRDPYHTTIKTSVLYNEVDALWSGVPDQLVAFDLQPSTVVLEAVWTGTVDTGFEDFLQYEVHPESDPEAEVFGAGPNPLRVQFDADFFPRGEYAIRYNVYPSILSVSVESRGDLFLTIFYVEPAPDGWSLAAGDT